MYTYPTMWRVTIWIQYVVYSNCKYNHTTFKTFHFGFRYILFPMNMLSRKKRVIHYVIRNPRKLKVRCCIPHMVEINKWSTVFPGVNTTDKIGEVKLNEIFLNIMSNVWSKQVYAQVFYCEILLLKYVNMFERIKIAENIYEDVV